MFYPKRTKGEESSVEKMDQRGMVGAEGYQFYSVVSIGVAEIGRAIFFPARGIFAR